MTGDDVYCADSCGRPATTERLDGVIPDGRGDIVEVVDLVCVHCAKESP